MSKFKIQNLQFFILLTFTFSFLTLHCFAQFGRETYEIDGLNEAEIPSVQVSTNLKSSVLSYEYIYPLSTLADGLYLDLDLGCKFGAWIDKSITAGVNSTGFVMIPVGTGLTFRRWNPVNFSLLGGFLGGFKANNLFTQTSETNPDDLFAGGFYVSGSIFVPLRNKLGSN